MADSNLLKILTGGGIILGTSVLFVSTFFPTMIGISQYLDAKREYKEALKKKDELINSQEDDLFPYREFPKTYKEPVKPKLFDFLKHYNAINISKILLKKKASDKWIIKDPSLKNYCGSFG